MDYQMPCLQVQVWIQGSMRRAKQSYIWTCILLLCEQMEEALPRPRSPEYYINPVIGWMTDEWKRVKKLLAKLVMDAAAGRKLKLEAKGIFPSGQSDMFAMMARLLKKYGDDTKSRAQEAVRAARRDAVPTLTTGPRNVTTIILSREGLQEVIDGMEFQMDFVDDLTKTVPQRVEKLLQGRYADLGSLKRQVNREFRLDRDGTLANFHDAVRKHAESVMDGRITPARFEERMRGSIGQYYQKMYREGKGAPLEAWEKEFVKRQVGTQDPYLLNFRNYIEQKNALGEELTGRITQRASLYAERGTALFETGHVASFPDDALIDWVLQPAEHCVVCPALAANSPYTKGTLPGYPGEGFTPCITNCKCVLKISDLYITEYGEPGPLDIDLPPSEMIAMRYSGEYEQIRQVAEQRDAMLRESLRLESEGKSVESFGMFLDTQELINEVDNRTDRLRMAIHSALASDTPADLGYMQFGNFTFLQQKQIGGAMDVVNKLCSQEAVGEGLVTFRKTTHRRSYFSRGGERFGINLYAPKSHDGVDLDAVHQIGHFLESSNADVKAKARAFYEGRTKGERLRAFGGAFGGDERYKPDRFMDKYMGKAGGGEITSTGLQWLYKDPYRLAQGDPEYFDFIVGLVQGK